MTSATSTMPASAILYRGGVTDFIEAMKLVESMCKREMIDASLYNAEYPDEAMDATSAEALLYAATRCKEEYLKNKYVFAQHPDDAALASSWLRSPDADVRRIGQALAAGDYSGLAE